MAEVMEVKTTVASELPTARCELGRETPLEIEEEHGRYDPDPAAEAEETGQEPAVAPWER